MLQLYRQHFYLRMPWVQIDRRMTVLRGVFMDFKRMPGQYFKLDSNQFLLVYLSDLVIMSSLLDPRVAGSNPAEVNGCLKVIKICCTTSFGREVKSGIKLIFFL
jgi:hypothetical protein